MGFWQLSPQELLKKLIQLRQVEYTSKGFSIDKFPNTREEAVL